MFGVHTEYLAPPKEEELFLKVCKCFTDEILVNTMSDDHWISYLLNSRITDGVSRGIGGGVSDYRRNVDYERLTSPIVLFSMEGGAGTTEMTEKEIVDTIT